MRHPLRFPLRPILTAGVLATIPACASVKVAVPGLEAKPEAAVTEKSALIEAAARLAAVTPPATEAGGLTLVVLGGRGDAETQAARVYLDALPTGSRLGALMADVDAVLTHARAVAEVGRPGPSSSNEEVALLEAAISDVQHARRVYVAALRLLREEGVPLTRAEILLIADWLRGDWIGR